MQSIVRHALANLGLREVHPADQDGALVPIRVFRQLSVAIPAEPACGRRYSAWYRACRAGATRRHLGAGTVFQER